MICSPPFLWKEAPEKKFLVPEEARTVLHIDKSSAVARSDWFAVEVKIPKSARSPCHSRVGEGEAQGEKRLAHSHLVSESHLHLRGVVDSFGRGRRG